MRTRRPSNLYAARSAGRSAAAAAAAAEADREAIEIDAGATPHRHAYFHCGRRVAGAGRPAGRSAILLLLVLA